MSFFQEKPLDHGCFSPLSMLWPHDPAWPGAVTVRRRDWRAMIHYGVIFFMLEKLGAVVGVSNLHIYAAMRGQSLEDFQKTRNAPGALYSVAAAAPDESPSWEKPERTRSGKAANADQWNSDRSDTSSRWPKSCILRERPTSCTWRSRR